MSYFQNVFTSEFTSAIGPIGDRQLNQSWRCPPHRGRGRDLVGSWIAPPYDLSGTDSDGASSANLTFRMANNASPNTIQWGQFSVDITAGAASTSAVTVEEIVIDLNADATFASWFTAELQQIKNNAARTTRKAVLIRQTSGSSASVGGQHERMRF